MAETITVGDISITPVRDAAIRTKASFLYPKVDPAEFARWSQYMEPETGRMEITVASFVLRDAGKTILVDTGLGDKARDRYPAGSLLENLRVAGIREEDVDIVVTTHLHVDHVGWNTVERDGERAITFPRARYIIVRNEWDYFTTDPERRQIDYIQDSVLPLEGSDQLELVDQAYVISPSLTMVPAPGHTPAHSCLAIVSRGERALIIGDLAHHPLQLTESDWEVVFDIDPALACRSREEMAERLLNEGALAIGGHFPWPGFGRVVKLDGRRLWQAL
ncbi:MAG: MBL fold metallo-hydrolase [Dehalococcoidia bacterium]|nr:MBL fold metallo-hydrolase [Dehalococcoidia bacterium]